MKLGCLWKGENGRKEGERELPKKGGGGAKEERKENDPTPFSPSILFDGC